jgi:alpha-L-rhamnosidase
LSWALTADEPNQKQTAYRILVASHEDRLAIGQADLWDSGRIPSSETLHIRYAGRPLGSGQRCWWQVLVWDSNGEIGRSSESAWWEMGLVNTVDWQARWISGRAASPLFRREFLLQDAVVSARLYICGLGTYEAFLNGQPVGDQPLAPILSYYPKRAYYDTYDTTGFLRAGSNVMGVWLAPGWFGDPEMGHDMGCRGQAWRRSPADIPAVPEPSHALFAQLHVRYADGRLEVIATDETWKTKDSGLEPVPSHRHYCFGFCGETLDNAVHPNGWNRAEYTDSGWSNARFVDAPSASLNARPMQANGVVEVIPPVASKPLSVETDDFEAIVRYALDAGVRNWATSATVPFFAERFGRRVRAGTARTGGTPLREAVEFDFGVHVSGWLELTVRGTPGDWVGVFGLDWYRLRGEGAETLRLHFIHRAFRYAPVFLYGAERAPSIESVRALAVQSAIPAVGSFACSDSELNRIHDAAARTWRSLLLSGMPMDSWQERFGTTLAQNLEPSLYWQDAGAFYTKWMQDHADAQRPDGYIPASGGPIAMDYWSSPTAQCAPLMAPWLMWRYYGDRDIVRRMYPVARAWLAFAEPSENDLDKTWKPPADHGDAEICVGDHGRFTARWYDARGGNLIETLFIIRFFQMAEEMARLLGEEADAVRYAGFINRLTAKINRPEFFDAARGLYADGDQGCHATALMNKVAPAGARARVEAALYRDILEIRGGHMNTGFFGTWFLLKFLDEQNRPDMAYRIVAAEDAPSWRSLLRHPASPEPLTVLPEFFTGGMIPHPGWCSVGLWFYQSLAGIHPDSTEPGFGRVIIRPRVPFAVDWVKAEYKSIRGPIGVHWIRKDGRFALTVTIPPNFTAFVHVPADDPAQVASPDGGCIRLSETELHHALFEVASGVHRFVSNFALGQPCRKQV